MSEAATANLTAQQMRALRQWGRHVDRFVVVGDDDQLLYSFSGARVEALIEPELPADQIRVLKHSWRVPANVHALANRWIGECSQRQPKEYLPRDGSPGSVARVPHNLRNPARLADHIGKLAMPSKVDTVIRPATKGPLPPMRTAST